MACTVSTRGSKPGLLRYVGDYYLIVRGLELTRHVFLYSVEVWLVSFNPFVKGLTVLGENSLKFEVVCRPNGTAVLRGVPKLSIFVLPIPSEDFKMSRKKCNEKGLSDALAAG